MIPTYGVWDSFESINFDSLPESFILKCTHDSGGGLVCHDKEKFDYRKASDFFKSHLKMNVYWQGNGREWVYKDVKPRILAEKYIPSLGHRDSIEYKITCCGGKASMITVCTGIAHSDFADRNNDHFDRDWNQLPFYAYYKSSGKKIDPPKELDQMVECVEKLSQGIPQVRVDGYIIDGTWIFGEMTFYTWNGFIEFVPKEWDEILGSWIELPEKSVIQTGKRTK